MGSKFFDLEWFCSNGHVVTFKKGDAFRWSKDNTKKCVICGGVMETRKVVCPNCGGEKVTSCEGGTNIQPLKGIRWICVDCCYEW